MEELKYKVYRLNKWNDNLKEELAAAFKDKQQAIEFVEHMASAHYENYGVFLDGERVDMLL